MVSDLGGQLPVSGDLSYLSAQGVLLLNATLTVRANTPGSHQKLGWEQFTDAIIKKLSADREHLVFLLWGNFAKQKATLIDSTKHLILTAPHPSPFSAYSGFFGCRHFSKTNAQLATWGLETIEWLPPVVKK
jgi:uracil-DNA glycosylase